jgi:hypothetical protein
VAAHLRKQIREAIATKVTGLTTTGARVFQSRVYPLEETDYPALRIYTPSEQSARTTVHAPALMQRTLTLRVEGVCRAVADVDDTLDLIAKEVETALAMPCSALAGIASYLTLVATDTQIDPEGHQPTGSIALTYEVLYHSFENTPDVAA